MEYKKLVKDHKKGDMMIKEFIVSPEWEEQEFMGESLTELGTPKIIVKNKSGRTPDFLIGGTSLPIVSDKAKNVIEKISILKNTGFEFLPVKLESYEGKQKYWVLNILIILDGLDYEKSEYILHDGSKSIREITKMVLLDKIIDNRDIFYLEESPVDVFVSEKLINAFEEEGINGYVIENLNGN